MNFFPIKLKKSDIIVIPMTPTVERSLSIDFSSIIYQKFYLILSRTNQIDSIDSDILNYLRNIHIEIWMLLVILFLIIFFINLFESILFQTEIKYNFWKIFRISLDQGKIKSIII